MGVNRISMGNWIADALRKAHALGVQEATRSAIELGVYKR